VYHSELCPGAVIAVQDNQWLIYCVVTQLMASVHCIKLIGTACMFLSWSHTPDSACGERFKKRNSVVSVSEANYTD
jgi:hypothetical protein